MVTIRDNGLFDDLKAKLEWHTLFNADFSPKNPNLPILVGGLDHITITQKAVTFHDIGCNGKGNTFRVMREINEND